MAITNLDSLLSGMKPPISFTKNTFTGEAAGQFHNLFAIAGLPGAGAFATPGVGGVAVTSATTIGGTIPFSNPSSGNAYLSKLSASVGANIIGLTLYDLLWYNSGLSVTTTTAQTVNSVAFSARDRLGTANGDGIEIWVYVAVATTNAGAVANTTYSYTNDSNASGRSAGLAYSFPASAVAGTMVPFALQASDKGVRSVQTVTLGTSYGAGTIHVLALRRIASLMFQTSPSGMVVDAMGLGMPQLFNDSALFFMALLSGTAAGTVTGELSFSHG